MKKQPASPAKLIKIPAIAGPKILAPLNIAEFKAIAFKRSSFPTISLIKACLVGASKAFTKPKHKAKNITCQTLTNPVKVRNAKIKAKIIAPVWVNMMNFRFFTRSANTPAGREKKRIGSPAKALTAPNRKGELVSLKTSQP